MSSVCIVCSRKVEQLRGDVDEGARFENRRFAVFMRVKTEILIFLFLVLEARKGTS